jgi:cytochrome P450
MASMLFALAYYPKVQAEIREEIEDIVKDFSNLSYQDIGLFKKIPALINEVFRYYSMTLNVVPRKAVDDFQV